MKKIVTLITLVLVAQIVSAQCQPVAEYSFSGNSNDFSGNGHHATNYGATLTTDRFGNPNSAYEFNGTSDYIDTETTFDYQERTVSMWVMAYDTSVNRVVYSQDANTLNYGRASIAFNPGSGIKASAGGEVAQQIYTNPNLNEWYHIVLIRNTTVTKVYVNGNLTQTGTSGTLGSSFDPNPESVFGVHRTTTQNFFMGKIDDVLIYDCELNTSQIDSLYNAQANQGPCIVADYNFSGNTNDISGNGYHATNYGATLTTDRFGNPNSAYEFNGTSDYIDTETSYDFQERTVSMWAMVYDTSSVRTVVVQDANTLDYGAFYATFRNGNLDASAGGETSHQIFPSPLLNTWYHIVLVRNTATIKIYVNGILTYTDASGTVGSSFTPNSEMVIGTKRSKDDNFFKGKIDDIQIYNCELSAEEVDSLYGDYDIYLGEETLETSGMIIYPNPMSEFTTIVMSKSTNQLANIAILDQQGRVVRKMDHVQENQITINKNNLAKGVYYIQLFIGGESPIVNKLVIE